MTRLPLSAVLVAAAWALVIPRAFGQPGPGGPADLLLRDFKPRSMLKAPVHEVERAAFPAVDVHNHVNDARNRVFARHPGTTFIALHVANHPEDLDDASAVLDLYPNVVVETGQGRWKISGLDLPKDVLEKVYAKNAERVIPASAGAGDRR